MRTIGARELKATMSEVLRNVRENEEVYVVTHRGQPVARLIPEKPVAMISRDLDRLWSEIDQLAEEISRDWPSGLSAAAAVSEDRREL